MKLHLYITFGLILIYSYKSQINDSIFFEPHSHFVRDSSDNSKQNNSNISSNDQIASLDVVGYSYKSLKADLIKVLILFTSYSKSATTALIENKKKVNVFLADIISNGIQKSDISFNSYDVTPKFAVKMNYDDSDEIEGYTISQEIFIFVKSKKISAKIIDSASNANGLLKSLQMVTPDSFFQNLKQELIKVAVKDSWNKARETANQLGYIITSVKSMKLIDNKMKSNENLEYVDTLQTYETFYLSVEVSYYIEKEMK